MPLLVQVSLNSSRPFLLDLYIQRAEGGTDPDDENVYLVGDMGYVGENPSALAFVHRYGDGAEVCLLRALAARNPDALPHLAGDFLSQRERRHAPAEAHVKAHRGAVDAWEAAIKTLGEIRTYAHALLQSPDDELRARKVANHLLKTLDRK